MTHQVFDVRSFSGTGGVTISAAGAGNISLTSVVPPRAVGAGNTTALQFFELAANGANFIGIKAPDAIAANVTFVLPAAPMWAMSVDDVEISFRRLCAAIESGDSDERR